MNKILAWYLGHSQLPKSITNAHALAHEHTLLHKPMYLYCVYDGMIPFVKNTLF